MKIGHSLVAFSVVFLCAVTACGDGILPHPRLMANESDFAAAKARLEKSELGSLALKRLLRESDALLDAGSTEYKKDKSGKRILHVSRNAITMIGRTALAYRFTGDERYAKRAIREALEVSAFPDWNPSHFLDTAEMTLAVSLCYDWLYDRLSIEERKILHDAILKKGLLNANGELHKGRWVNGHNNWTQVCHGGLVAGAVAIADTDPEIARKVIDRAVANLPIPMSVFAPDGGFPEGPSSYWPYAMQFNILAIWIIEKFDGTDHGLCSLPGFAAEVDLRDSCTGPTGLMFNFSDCGGFPKGGRGVEFSQWWLAKRFNRPDTLKIVEIPEFRKFVASRVAPEKVRNYDRMYPFLLLCFEEPASDASLKTPARRVIRGENEIAMARTSWEDTEAWYVALKGGRPSCSHGHEDVGSFVLDAMGVRWTYDIGCENYATIEASKEVGDKLWNFRQESPRWTLFRYSVEGHGTLQFNDEQQNVNATACFTDFAEDANSVTTLDLSKLYGRDVKRTFTLGEKNGFDVKDSISGAAAGDRVTWRINIVAEAAIKDNVAILTAKDANGKTKKLRVVASPEDVEFTVVDCSKRRRHFESDTPGLRQLTFTRTVPASGKLSFGVSFVPGE